MKEFNLEAALAGKPVKLRNGDKAYVKYNRLEENEIFLPRDTAYPLIGYRLEGVNCYTTSWTLTGETVHFGRRTLDIVEMWEEPKISIEDLPKPFKPKDREPFYYIYWGEIYCDYGYSESSSTYRSFSQNGQCFRTKEDAQKWLDFMKSMME